MLRKAVKIILLESFKNKRKRSCLEDVDKNDDLEKSWKTGSWQEGRLGLLRGSLLGKRLGHLKKI